MPTDTATTAPPRTIWHYFLCDSYGDTTTSSSNSTACACSFTACRRFGHSTCLPNRTMHSLHYQPSGYLTLPFASSAKTTSPGINLTRRVGGRALRGDASTCLFTAHLLYFYPTSPPLRVPATFRAAAERFGHGYLPRLLRFDCLIVWLRLCRLLPLPFHLLLLHPSTHLSWIYVSFAFGTLLFSPVGFSRSGCALYFITPPLFSKQNACSLLPRLAPLGYCLPAARGAAAFRGKITVLPRCFRFRAVYTRARRLSTVRARWHTNNERHGS